MLQRSNAGNHGSRQEIKNILSDKGGRQRWGVYGKETVEDQKLADLRAGTTDVFQIPSR